MSKGNLIKETPYSEITATLEVFDRHGVTRDHFARFRSDGGYAKRVAEFMLRGGIESSAHHKFARAIMDKNFFGVENWVILHGANFSQKQLRKVVEFPWGEDILMSPCPFVKGMRVRDTHFAFLGVPTYDGEPLTVRKWLRIGAKRFRLLNNIPLVGQPHLDETTELRWYLLLRDIVPDSDGKTYEDQIAMMPTEYEIPTIVVEVAKDILVFHKTGEYPNYTRWAACRERTVKIPGNVADLILCVGPFISMGIGIHGWSGDRNIGVGIAASRIPGK